MGLGDHNGPPTATAAAAHLAAFNGTRRPSTPVPNWAELRERQRETPQCSSLNVYVYMYAYSIPAHTYIIIERCLIVCFVFCFSAHSRREESLARSLAARLCPCACACSTVDRCLLSNYHKQIRPKPNRDRDRRLTDRRTDGLGDRLPGLTVAALRAVETSTEVPKSLATRRAERRFCCVDTRVITILYVRIQ